MTQSSGQDGIQPNAAFERREQLMFAHQPKLDPAMPSRATAPGRSQGEGFLNQTRVQQAFHPV